MSNYDGPSLYKKQHPKIQAIRQNEQYENKYKKTMPKRIQTRKDIEEDVVDYMKLPIEEKKPGVDEAASKRKESLTQKIEEEKQRMANNRFRHKHIPPSLQTLDGWRKPTVNVKLLERLRERLAKDADSYILFATAEDAKQEPKPPQNKKTEVKDSSLKDRKNVKRVQEKMSTKLLKPASGLHRSLSGIMAEDQQDYKNGRRHLDSLFSEDK